MKYAILLLFVIFLSACNPSEKNEVKVKPETPTAENEFSREEVDHAFGTKAGKTVHPETAIDTTETPNIVIDENSSPDALLKFYEISKDTFMFFGNVAEVDEVNRGSNGNAGFVVTNEGVVVIDSLGSPKLGKQIIASIKEKTDKPIRYLIITHNHPDHAYGAPAFRALKDVTIIGHEGTLKYLNSDRIDHSVAYRKTFIAADMEAFEAVEPDALVGGERFSKHSFTLGGKTFDLYNTGVHHSYGDLVVHQVEDRVVWISDLAFNQRVTFMADGGSQAAIEGQGWLLEKFADAKLMVPGHGSAQTAPFEMVSKTRSYMQRLREVMTKAVEEDVELQDAVESNEFEEWKDVPLYELNHRKNLEFVYREMEQVLF